MTADLVLVGAGGFARETLDVIDAINNQSGDPIFTVVGVLDDSPTRVALERVAARGVNYLGTTVDWLAQPSRAEYLVCIGNPRVRARIDLGFRAAGLHAATVIHPRATIGSLSQIGQGSVVCSGAEISTNVALGRHAHVNPNATIGHDAVLADYVSINPGAIISGEVSIGSETLIGAGAVVLQGLTIGTRSTVGASACVTRNVNDNTTVMGIPAR